MRGSWNQATTCGGTMKRRVDKSASYPSPRCRVEGNLEQHRLRLFVCSGLKVTSSSLNTFPSRPRTATAPCSLLYPDPTSGSAWRLSQRFRGHHLPSTITDGRDKLQHEVEAASGKESMIYRDLQGSELPHELEVTNLRPDRHCRQSFYPRRSARGAVLRFSSRRCWCRTSVRAA